MPRNSACFTAALLLLYCCFTDALRMLCLRQLFSTQHFANIAWAYVFLKVSKPVVKQQ
jgi:hypothetical protein